MNKNFDLLTHTTRGGQCRQECGERGYYHLHQQLNQSFLSHNYQLSIIHYPF